MRNVLGIILGVGILLTASSALAQPTEPQPQPPPPQPGVQVGGQVEGGLPTPKPVVAGPVTGNVVREEGKKDDGISDHERVVGKFGVMYHGISQTPIGTGAPGGVQVGTPVQTPVIGVRYWLSERMGIDGGIGFGIGSSSQTVKPAGGAEISTDGPAVVAFALHAGLPLAFAYGKHYKFLLVPELNFGYATQTVAAQNQAPGAAPIGDTHFKGLRFDVGARVGTEIQFGFIGIPELALQATIGLNFRYQHWSASQDAAGATAETSSTRNQTNFGTTVQNDPWALFVNNISAIYYFP